MSNRSQFSTIVEVYLAAHKARAASLDALLSFDLAEVICHQAAWLNGSVPEVDLPLLGVYWRQIVPVFNNTMSGSEFEISDVVTIFSQPLLDEVSESESFATVDSQGELSDPHLSKYYIADGEAVVLEERPNSETPKVVDVSNELDRSLSSLPSTPLFNASVLADTFLEWFYAIPDEVFKEKFGTNVAVILDVANSRLTIKPLKVV